MEFLQACLHTIIRVSVAPRVFRPCNHHQTDQIHINWSRIDRGIPQQSHRFYSPFCSSATLRSPMMMFSRKRFVALLPLASVGITGSQSNSRLRLHPYRLCRTVHVLPLRCLAGVGEYLSRKTGHFASWERLIATRSSPCIVFNRYSILVECGRIPPV